MKIALILMTPSRLGGTESSLFHVKKGFIHLGHEADLIAVGSARSQSTWPAFTVKNLDYVLSSSFDEIEDHLSGYDGIILSNMIEDASAQLLKVLFTSAKIPSWTCARHRDTRVDMAEAWQKKAMASPRWTGSYVSFWPSSRQLADAKWIQSVLPFSVPDTVTEPPPVKDRPIDFLYMGRVESQKGLYAFIAAMEGLRRNKRDDQRPFVARMAGEPLQLPGGPATWEAAQLMEKWGWNVTRHGTNRSTSWDATSTAGDKLMFTGKYGFEDATSILDSGKIFYNLTTHHVAPDHMEYATMEAILRGGIVCADTDWPEYQYPDESLRPEIVTVPRSAIAVVKRSRIVYADRAIESPDTSYKDLVLQVTRAFTKITGNIETLDDIARKRWIHNCEALRESHHPKIAAQAYLDALDGKGDYVRL